MVLPVQKFREIVFHLLYSAGYESSYEDVVALLMQHHEVTKKSIYMAQEEVNSLMAYRGQIDQLIKNYSKDYELDRIPSVEKNILRLAIFEMLYSKKVPPKVAISEAIRLSRKFSTAESAQFINGVLNSVYQENLVLC